MRSEGLARIGESDRRVPRPSTAVGHAQLTWLAPHPEGPRRSAGGRTAHLGCCLNLGRIGGAATLAVGLTGLIVELDRSLSTQLVLEIGLVTQPR